MFSNFIDPAAASEGLLAHFTLNSNVVCLLACSLDTLQVPTIESRLMTVKINRVVNYLQPSLLPQLGGGSGKCKIKKNRLKSWPAAACVMNSHG